MGLKIIRLGDYIESTHKIMLNLKTCSEVYQVFEKEKLFFKDKDIENLLFSLGLPVIPCLSQSTSL